MNRWTALGFLCFALGVLLDLWALRKRVERLERLLRVDPVAEAEAELQEARRKLRKQ